VTKSAESNLFFIYFLVPSKYKDCKALCNIKYIGPEVNLFRD